jgi:pimeloyl-ACP methyl ester carboxylesterase
MGRQEFLGIRATFQVALVCGLAGLLLPAPPGQARPGEDKALNGIHILPSATDPRISTFDRPHLVMVNRSIVVHRDPNLPADRHQLLLFLPGTQSGKRTGKQSRITVKPFFRMAAMLGYHVIALQYPNDTAASVCRNENDPEAYEKFRMAIIAGGKSRFMTVRRVESIENRLILLLRFLAKRRPAEKWDQFLTADGGINWAAVAVSGHSQGGGHAALIAINHRVARVICTGSPKDYSRALQAPAAWYARKSATPKQRFFAFNHRQDNTTCSVKQQRQNLRALGLTVRRAATDVDTASPPYNHSRVLTTNHPGTRLDSQTAHAAVLSPANAKVFGKVWRYLLTEPTR